MDHWNEAVKPLREADTAGPWPDKPFGKAVAETYEGIKQDFAGKGGVEPNVREQVNSDLDKLIEHNKAKKY